MSPLHKAPRGLLELLRLRTQGEQPNKFGDTVLPVIDGHAFYVADLLVTTQGALGTGAINSPNPLTSSFTPTTDPVQLIAIGGVIVMGAVPGTYVQWSVQLNTPGPANPGAQLASGTINPSGAAGQVLRFGFTLPQVLVVGAGSFFQASINGDGTGTDHTLSLRLALANLSALS